MLRSVERDLVVGFPRESLGFVVFMGVADSHISLNFSFNFFASAWSVIFIIASIFSWFIGSLTLKITFFESIIVNGSGSNSFWILISTCSVIFLNMPSLRKFFI